MQYLWFFRRDLGLDRTIQQTSIDLFHSRLYFRRDLIVEIVVWSIGDIAFIVAAGKAAVPCILEQLKHTWCNLLHGAGEHAGSRFGKGHISVRVDADGR